MATQARAPAAETSVMEIRPRPRLTGLVFFSSDAGALALCPVFAFPIWQMINPEIPQIMDDFWAMIWLFHLVYAFEGLYPGVGVTPIEELRRLTISTSLVFLFLTAAAFILRGGQFGSRGVFLTSWLFALVLVPFARGMICHLFGSAPWFGVPVVILGAGETAKAVIHRLSSQRALGFRPVACLDDDPMKRGDILGVPVAGDLSMAEQVAVDFHARHAILAMPGLSRARLLPVLEHISGIFSHVILIPNLFGVASLWVKPRDLGGVLGLELRHNLLIPANRILKRVLDLILAVLVMTFAVPLIIVFAAWIKIVNPGAAFFTQEREGSGGQPIRIYKLRTMYAHADKLLERHLDENINARLEWNRYFKLKDDPRILPGVGRFLRRTSLDELPQLWNILKGDMSLVGPRPFPAYHNASFPPEFRSLRCKVRPGLTGMWQISERSNGDLEVQEQLDTYYIRNWSIWLDLYILSRTARAVLFPSGAY